MRMKIIYLRNFKHCKMAIKNLSLVLGYFDGVHIGHSGLISFAKANSAQNALGVLTFDRALKSIEGCITSNTLKDKLFEDLGVDYLFVIVCDDNFKSMSYITFVDKVLKALNPIKIFCGSDFHFGYERQGDVNYLKARFNQVYVLHHVTDHNGNKISSTNIKNEIKKGNIEEADRWLGRPYIISGSIVHGLNNGDKIGFPTANLTPDDNYIMPKNGVYITKLEVDGVKYKSITNIGVHPTIEKLNQPIIETNVVGYEGNLYGKIVSLFFYKRLRDEKEFNNVEELKKQIALDKDEAKHYFLYNKLKSDKTC